MIAFLLASSAFAQEAVPPTVPIHVGVIPGVGWPDDRVDVDGLSVNLIAGMANDVHGVEGGLVANWDRGDLRGAQGTVGVNVVEGEVRGVQGSVVANVAVGHVSGVQATSGVNVAVGGIRGVQASPCANVAGEVVGLQATSGVDLAATVRGAQAGVANVAGQIHGLQAGIVNVGGHVDGAQLGIVNVASDVDGASIGMLNFVRHGRNAMRVYGSDLNWLNAGVKFGSKPFHTFVGVGQDEPGSDWWSTGLGWGGHIDSQRLWLDIDAQGWTTYQGLRINPNFVTRGEVELGMHWFKHASPFVGVAVSTSWNAGGVHPKLPNTADDAHYQHALAVTWPGFTLGVEL